MKAIIVIITALALVGGMAMFLEYQAAPIISIDPQSISAEVGRYHTTDAVFNISNAGDADLHYQITGQRTDNGFLGRYYCNYPQKLDRGLRWKLS